MVNKIRKALAGFILLPGGPKAALPGEPHFADRIYKKACPLRGYYDKNNDTQLFLLTGLEESDVLRHLRAVVVEKEQALNHGRSEEGLNIAVFRGVFGSGGYDVDVKGVRFQNGEIEIDCDFENPGPGIRTTAGFTQPTAVIPLKALPPGKYRVRLMVRTLCRSSQGVQEEAPRCEKANMVIKVR